MIFKSFFHLFQPSVAFHIETSHLICSAKQMTGFYTKRNTVLKWVNTLQNVRLNFSKTHFEPCQTFIMEIFSENI